jgi:hypothetical protein
MSEDVALPSDRDAYGPCASDDETQSDYEEQSDSATQSDTDYEDDGEVDWDFSFGDGGGWNPTKKTKKKKATPGANGGLPNFKLGLYDKEYWSCVQVGPVGQFVKMTDVCHGGCYVVPIARVNKALRFLHQPSIAALLRASTGLCRCKRNPRCFQRGVTTLSILVHRHSYFQQLDEHGATKYLADLVRPHNMGSRSSAPSKTKDVWTVRTHTHTHTHTHTKGDGTHTHKGQWVHQDGVC